MNMKHIGLGLSFFITVASQATEITTPQTPVVQASKQVAGFYHFPLGQFQVTALYDGYVKLPSSVFKGQRSATLEQLLKSNYVDYKDGIQTAVNAYLVNTGKHLVLIDSGAAKCFGSTLGSIEDNINAAGYTPDQIDMVLLTHLHPDHACGISAVEGQKSFPNATVYVNQAEDKFWLNPDNLQKYPKDKQAIFKSTFDSINKLIQPYQASKQYKTYQVGDNIIDGIKIVPTYGHTVGHTSYLIESNQQKLLVVGDIVHNHTLQFQNPNINLDFDYDAKQAIQIRKSEFAQAAKQGTLLAGAHLPFPGIGHVRALSKDKFEWIPVEYAPQVNTTAP